MTMQDPGNPTEGMRRRSKRSGQVDVFRNGDWVTIISPTYARGMDTRNATLDAETLSAARAGGAGSVDLARQGGRVQDLINQGAPVGGGADVRIALGRHLPDVVGRYVPGIPDKRETSMLEEIQRIGNRGALGDVKGLPGPLSEKELAFIRELQINPNATAETNNRIANTYRWAGARSAAYSRAADSWQAAHGGLSIPAPNGMNFYQWWPQWSEQNLPFPANEGPQATTESPTALLNQGYVPNRETGVYERTQRPNAPQTFEFDPTTGQLREAQ